MSRIVRKEVRKRGPIGFIVKWTFIVFNLAMAFWLVSYWVTLAEMRNELSSDAEMVGAAIGGSIGSGVILVLWATGTIVLGILTLLSRGKVTIIEETTT